MRPVLDDDDDVADALQFLRELHFIEASTATPKASYNESLQFLRELHFIEA